MTRKGRLAAIALLLMAMLMLAACSGGRGNPGSTAPNDVAVAAMKAMTQAADTAGQAAGVSSTGNTYTLTGFTADDGVTRVVGGSFEMDGNGNVINADLTLQISNQTLEFILKPASTGTGSDITVDTTPVSESVMPDPMTPEEKRAFRIFLIGFDEVQDDVREAVEEAFDDIEDIYRKPGQVNISHPLISGTIELGREKDDDWDDLEVIGGNVRFTDFPIDDDRHSGKVSGSYSFELRDDDYERATMSVTISSYHDDGISLSNFAINGTIIEDEIRDDDRFTFDGTASGTFDSGTGSSRISFDGKINAEEDSWIEFPEYSLKIDGREVAIGRPERPFI